MSSLRTQVEPRYVKKYQGGLVLAPHEKSEPALIEPNHVVLARIMARAEGLKFRLQRIEDLVKGCERWNYDPELKAKIYAAGLSLIELDLE